MTKCELKTNFFLLSPIRHTFDMQYRIPYPESLGTKAFWILDLYAEEF
jgi:hypothetical protein